MSVEVKNLVVSKKGMEFEIRDAAGNFKGDLIIAAEGLTWCKGKTTKKNGTFVTWERFIKDMEQRDA